MKKILMGASALAFASVSGAAVAQTWNTTVSGGSVVGFGYVDSNVVEDGQTIINRFDATVRSRLTADNGLSFDAYIVLRNNSGNIDQDGVGASVSGSFGTVQVGERNGAHRIALPRVPRSAFTAAGRGGGILFDGDYSRGQVPAGIGDDRGGNTGFGTKITYLSPRFSGFQAGVSYSTGNRGSNRTVAADDISRDYLNEGFEFGANYTNTFGDFRVALGAGYTTFTNSNATLDQGYALSGNLGWGPFTVGASYGVQDFNSGSNVEVLALGATYATGPWTFGLGFGMNVNGRQVDLPAPIVDTPTLEAALRSTSTRDRDGDYGISFGVDYALAPGVTTGLVLEYSDADKSARGRNNQTDQEAFAVGVFLGLQF